MSRYRLSAGAAVVAELEEKRSVFRCSLQRAGSEGEARGLIAQVRKQAADARHHCTAFIVPQPEGEGALGPGVLRQGALGPGGIEGAVVVSQGDSRAVSAVLSGGLDAGGPRPTVVTQRIERSNDDGEPAGTAGMPMLEVLRGAELEWVVAVVTRWFGGVKLGTGGLVRAYGAAVQAAVEQARGEGRLSRVEERSEWRVMVPYSIAGKAEAAIRASSVTVAGVEHGDAVWISVQAGPDYRSSDLQSVVASAVGQAVEITAEGLRRVEISG